MTIFRQPALLSILLLLLYKDAKSQDLTEDGRNGCIWQGGSISRLICNCESDAEITIKSGSISSTSTSEIIINGCKTLTIQQNAIADLRNLRMISLNSIQSIYFESDSINWFGYRDNAARAVEEERFDVFENNRLQ
ncbi:unnamed protein product [Psylliodes chrysocephalus]|uniref:Uncharacterized protein n=1 Tax=Psylliodes chrysocephalus TaxID=3402493 RepID=A0A9P0CV18_9CUCU|nr:unnamed protein product [Psylliodes chrysocephala]